MFEKNESRVDRVARAVAGAGLLGAACAKLGARSGKPLGVLAAAVGVTLLLTAAVGRCPLYRLSGVGTAPWSYDIRESE